ncbi:hypothetical protein F2Q68_00026219 [Brassica cretica]|uniref:Uncharacterized protein n=1 Tax=Brassica cretica TaxID=69181 RepID=A0A8S9IDU5_BRACR|nr:hypothetical protein F2Q68_00026219 [Brassica cretica]
MGNPCRLVLDMSRSGLTVPGRLAGKSVPLQAHQGFLLHPETQRKPEKKRERESDCSIQDQEWCEGSKEAVLWAITRGVENDPLMAFSGGAWSSMIREGTRSRRIMYKDALVVRVRLIGFIGTWFHGRLGKCEDSSVLSHVGWDDVQGLGRTDHDRDLYDLALLEVARNVAEDFRKLEKVNNGAGLPIGQLDPTEDMSRMS